MSFGWTIWLAAWMTWCSSGRPPISCRTLARFDLSRVPLPAAMMTMASCIRTGYRVQGLGCRFRVQGCAPPRQMRLGGHPASFAWPDNVAYYAHVFAPEWGA